MKATVHALIGLVIVSSLTSLAWAKGATRLIVVDGALLSSSIEISDPEIVGSFDVWIGIDDDSLFDAFGNSGANVVEPPSNKPWAYEMTIADPDGNLLWLGAEPRV